MNKRGDGEHFLSIWMFAVWVIIGIGIIAGIYMFYSAKIDAREVQSDFLTRRIVDCVRENDLTEDVLTKCGVSLDVLSGENFFVRINVSDSRGERTLVQRGNPDIETQCSLREEVEAKSFARCSPKGGFEFMRVSEGEEVIVKVFSGSNNLGGELYG